MNRRVFLSRAAVAYASVQASEYVNGESFQAAASNSVHHVTQVSAKAPEKRPQVELFPLTDVSLLDGPFKTQQEMNRKYLLKLEPDRLLSHFLIEAGLDPKGPPYRGWESEPPNALWGHILGFYLSGTGMMVQATGDKELRSRLDYITDRLDAVQQANGSGYLLPVPKGKKLFADVAAGNFEITHSSKTYGYEINNVFEPTYTWNKITLGLYHSYLATGNPKTRAVLVRTADWFGHDVLDHLSDEQVQHLLFCEHGSINESMLVVYTLTNDPKYLKWAQRLCFERILQPLANGDTSFLNGYHANCSIPVYTGAEKISQYTGDPQLHTAAITFLDDVITRRSWANGGNSANEHFFPPEEFEKALHAKAGPESCNSVNMLRLIEATYPYTPAAQAMDHYERILWNHLLAVHEPERGMFAYYTPMQPGMYRVYSDEFDSMWCCVGTGLEAPGKYGQMIYTHAPGTKSVDVNLFIASELNWKEAGLQLRQDTSFPDVPESTLTVVANPAGHFTLRIRHPWWVPKGEFHLILNGTPLPSDSAPGEYAELSRVWHRGDKLRVALPTHLRVEPLPHSQNYAALLAGPIVLSGMLGTEGLQKRDFWQIQDAAPRVILAEEHFPGPDARTGEELLSQTSKHGERAMEFELESASAPGGKLTLIPLFRNYYQRYAVYWKLKKDMPATPAV